jgi:hypothetical protein
MPLTPDRPAFEVISTVEPLLDCEPYPDRRDSRPPDCILDIPDDTITLPPAPLSPDPTPIVKDPPRPLFEIPVPIRILPLLPTLDEPVLKTTKPLEPDTPAFAVENRRDPLVDMVPRPVTIVTLPPVDEDEAPPRRVRSRPTPLLLSPTDIDTTPPWPESDDPDPKYSPPLLPELDVPVLSTMLPLTPDSPAFDVCMSKLPLLDRELWPVNIFTEPPVFS